jgi:hypothetical protein
MKARNTSGGLSERSSWLRPALCLRYRPARSQRTRLDQRYRESDRGMGCTSDHGGISLGRGSRLHDPGPGSHLWRHRHASIACHGHSGQAYCTTSPWQKGFAERLIGCRECLDYIVVFGEAHLLRILRSYARYYKDVRTHRSLDKDAPISRPVQRTGSITLFRILGGLHHRYARV